MAGGASSFQDPKRVVLASRAEHENTLLQKKLQPLHEAFPEGVRMISTRPLAAHLEIQSQPDLVIFNFTDLNSEEMKSLNELRTGGYSKMVLVLGKCSSPQLVTSLRSLERVVYLEKPFENRDLVGIAEKSILKGAVSQQIHRRYHTEQSALVEFDEGRPVGSRVLNMSKTGAYLELNTLQDVRVGDEVKLRLDLDDMKRTYVMPARIIWSQVMGRTGGTGVGVHFTGRGAVKRHIVQL